jgi:hypothetical protein
MAMAFPRGLKLRVRETFSPHSRSIYYHHIGKTGGTSITGLLAAAVGPRSTFPQAGLTRHLLGRLDRYRFFSGHFPFAVVALLPRPITVITSVRDPLPHLVSTYNHLKRLAGRHIALAHRSRPLASFDDFLADPVLRRITTNPQTFSLGREIPTATLRGVAEHIVEVDWYETGTRESFWGLYGTEDDDRTGPGVLAVARKRLADPAMIACTCETIDGEIGRIMARVGLRSGAARSVPARLNQKPDREDMLDVSDLSAAQVAAVRAQTMLDRTLYEEVRARTMTRAAA